MIYFIDESWNYPDESNHCPYPKAYRSKKDALLSAKELIENEKELFEHINKEYHIIVSNDGYTIATIDSEYEYTVTVIEVKESISAGIYEALKLYDFISYKYKNAAIAFKKDPDFVEVDIKWKGDDKTERTIIAFNDKHDDLVTFRVDNLFDLTLLFLEDSKEDFVCEHVHNMYFGIWD